MRFYTHNLDEIFKSANTMHTTEKRQELLNAPQPLSSSLTHIWSNGGNNMTFYHRKDDRIKRNSRENGIAIPGLCKVSETCLKPTP